MFYERIGGSFIPIKDNAFGFVYNCQLCEVGYGVNVANDKIEKTDILCSSDNPQEQYWVRPVLPIDYNPRRKKEKEVQKIDPYYRDPYLEEIRKREWGRRLRGVWFWNYNPSLGVSECIYITGAHYFYLTYWKFQGKHMEFRMPDRDVWYVAAYCCDDPCSLGLNEMTKRRNGKSARMGCWLYERTSRMANHHGGVQSKGDEDVKDFFKKAVVQPWKTLPDFFRPLYDTMKGDDPNDEIRFFATSRRGSKTEEEISDDEEPLNSFIDHKAASESAFDGSQLESYVSDEGAKLKKPMSIIERQNVVRYCCELDGEFIGKSWYASTVEPEKGEPENYEFQEMTAKSNPLERDDNGRTGTGLYTYFLPAHKGLYFDKYGYPDEEKAKVFLMNTRRKYEEDGDTRKLSSFKRKNPMTFKEAFSADGEYALYDPELLNNQLDEISWDTQNHLTERGNLKWKDGHRFKRPQLDASGNEIKIDGKVQFEPNEVIWEANVNGKFEKVVGWFPEKPNEVVYDGRYFKPNNKHAYRVGCDPFKYDKTKSKRRSNCAAFVYQMPDTYIKSDFDDVLVLRYAYRESSTRAANEDVAMMGWLCGCEVLFERNVGTHKDHFIEWEIYPFLMYLDGEVEPGVITTGDSIQTICNYTETYINKHIKKVYFKSLIRKDTGWLGFKVEDHESYDECMAAGVVFIAVNAKKYRKTGGEVPITSYFRRHKISA